LRCFIEAICATSDFGAVNLKTVKDVLACLFDDTLSSFTVNSRQFDTAICIWYAAYFSDPSLRDEAPGAWAFAKILDSGEQNSEL